MIVVRIVCCYVQTTEVTVSTPQRTVSETSYTDKRPVQQPASSVSDDAAALSNSLPPRTLSFYPVYKPTNIRVGSSADDKFRPLSYRWLIGHCAEHIYVKPSIVERYVERLELLHIVPRNPHDYRERTIRSGLIRRCFKPVTKDCSTPDDTPRRCRRRLLRTLPPRKLL